MAFTAKLAELFVQFTTRGIEAVAGAIEKAHQGLAKVKEGADAVGRVATVGFAAASASIGGFIRAGMQGTAVGDLLSYRMAELSRTIAGLFGPEIRKAVQLVESITNWFRHLSDTQRDGIVWWIKTVVVGSAVAALMPRLLGGIQSVIGGVMGLAGALGLIDVETGGILPLIGAIVTALTGLAVGAGVASGSFGDFADALQPIMDALGKLYDAAMTKVRPFLEQMAGGFAVFLQHLEPLIPVIEELAGAMLEALAPVAESIIDLLPSVADVLVTVATVVKNLAVPALEAMAWALERVAGAIASITGNDMKEIPVPEPKKKQDDSRGPLAPASHGFEAVEAAYTRIAQASVKIGMGKSVADNQLDEARRQTGIQEQIRQAVSNARPAVV